jgi:hypothetical protein
MKKQEKLQFLRNFKETALASFGLLGTVKVFRVDKEENETVETAVEAALAQIEEKKYVTELMERGIKNIKKLAVVFSGKDVYVKEKMNPEQKNR